MRNKVSYEWSIQRIDSRYGDVIDNEFADQLSEYLCDDVRDAITRRHNESHESYKLVLIRYFGNEDDGEQDREYAEVHQAFDVIDGEAIPIDKWQLPLNFEFGNKVPKRFHDELGSAIKRLLPNAEPTFRGLESMF